MGWLEKVLDLVRSSPKYVLIVLVAVFMVSGTLLVCDSNILKFLRMDSFVDKYGTWVGLTFATSIGLLTSILFFAVLGLGWPKYTRFRESRQLEKTLQSLTLGEQTKLAGYVLNKTQTRYFGKTDGVVAGLELKGIIHRVTENDQFGDAAYNVHLWAWESLKKNPCILKDFYRAVYAHPEVNSEAVKRMSRQVGVGAGELRAVSKRVEDLVKKC